MQLNYNTVLLIIISSVIITSTSIGPRYLTIVGAEAVEKFTTYMDPVYNFKVNHPSNWNETINRDIDEVVFSPPENNDVIFSISVSDAANMNLNQLAGREISMIREIDSCNECPYFNITSSDPNSSISGIPAYKITYDFEREKSHILQGIAIITDVAEKGYTIKYLAEPDQFSKYFPTIQRMIELLEDPSTQDRYSRES